MITIIYIATNGYTTFSEKFLNSVKYFLPGKEKRILIYTNLPNSIDKNNCDSKDVVEINISYIFDFIYPTLNVNKTYIVDQIIEQCKDDDYVFYFDADTIFKDNENYDWNKLISYLDEGYVLLAKHPFYAMDETESLWGTKRDDLIKNLYSYNLTEKREYSMAYIPAYSYTYINSSFYAGKKEPINKFNKLITERTRTDLTRYYGVRMTRTYHIPQYVDESFFNRTYYDYQNGKLDDIKLLADQFTELYNLKNKDIDTVFMYQKNIDGEKTNRR